MQPAYVSGPRKVSERVSSKKMLMPVLTLPKRTAGGQMRLGVLKVAHFFYAMFSKDLSKSLNVFTYTTKLKFIAN